MDDDEAYRNYRQVQATIRNNQLGREAGQPGAFSLRGGSPAPRLPVAPVARQVESLVVDVDEVLPLGDAQEVRDIPVRSGMIDRALANIRRNVPQMRRRQVQPASAEVPAFSTEPIFQGERIVRPLTERQYADMREQRYDIMREYAQRLRDSPQTHRYLTLNALAGMGNISHNNAVINRARLYQVNRTQTDPIRMSILRSRGIQDWDNPEYDILFESARGL